MGRKLMLVAPMFFAVVVVCGVALVLSACAGGGGAGGGGSKEQAKAKEEEAKARPLPPVEKALRPGEYRSEKFEPPLSFRVGKGWWSGEQELPDFMQLASQERTAYLRFANIKEVYKPGTQDAVKVPEDLVGWFQDHPYLKVEGLEPITVGGIEGQQFDFVADVPEGRYSMCGADCVDAFENSDGSSLILDEGDQYHARILDVKGETVYIESAAPPANWDKVAPVAQKVVESVKWGGS
jgi:hypothetical protein